MIMMSTKLAVMNRRSYLNRESRMRTTIMASDVAADRAGRPRMVSQTKFRKPQARTKIALATTSASDHSMMAKAAIWIDVIMATNHPSTVAEKPTRLFRKAIVLDIDECLGIPNRH